MATTCTLDNDTKHCSLWGKTSMLAGHVWKSHPRVVVVVGEGGAFSTTFSHHQGPNGSVGSSLS